MISAVPQNRFAAPQRIQRNNQAQSFGSKPLEEEPSKTEKSSSGTSGLFGGFALSILMAIGLPILTNVTRTQGAEARDKQLIPIIDSLSNHKINAGNVDAFIQQKELRQQADSLLKAAGKVK